MDEEPNSEPTPSDPQADAPPDIVMAMRKADLCLICFGELRRHADTIAQINRRCSRSSEGGTHFETKADEDAYQHANQGLADAAEIIGDVLIYVMRWAAKEDAGYKFSPDPILHRYTPGKTPVNHLIEQSKADEFHLRQLQHAMQMRIVREQLLEEMAEKHKSAAKTLIMLGSCQVRIGDAVIKMSLRTWNVLKAMVRVSPKHMNANELQDASGDKDAEALILALHRSGRIWDEVLIVDRKVGFAVKAGRDESHYHPPEEPLKVLHSADYSAVNWFGTLYNFSAGNQREAVKALWEEFEKNPNFGLHEKTIGEKIKSSAEDFRLAQTFRGHPAWQTMIVPAGKGAFRLNSGIIP